MPAITYLVRKTVMLLQFEFLPEPLYSLSGIDEVLYAKGTIKLVCYTRTAIGSAGMREPAACRQSCSVRVKECQLVRQEGAGGPCITSRHESNPSNLVCASRA